jgi:cysteinyl-tRNA synthetase
VPSAKNQIAAACPPIEPQARLDDDLAVKPLHIFNSLTRTVEKFSPLNPPEVTYYSCGPTVYLPQHLGNMRAYLFVDTLRRVLKFNGYKVRHVMNITDVGHMTSDADAGEDKVEKTARAQGKTPAEVAEFYIAQFKADCARLNIELPPPPFLCRATEHIGDMIALIERILKNRLAYVVHSGVYFDVEKWRGTDRSGRLSRQSLDEQHGQRLEHAADKKSPHDFALWVLNQPGHLMQWDSPWGRGYPGWHIECSAMSMKYLGETLDIHSGGLDHIPVHHENEIAQSEGATGHQFVRYFVHNAFLVGMEGAKISKSAGRFPILDDLVSAGIDPLAFRLLCFGAKYRSELAFSLDAVRAAEKNLDYINEFVRVAPESDDDISWAAGFRERFDEALNNDLNTPQALAAVLEMIAESNRRNERHIWRTLAEFDQVLGLGLAQRLSDMREPPQFPSEVEELRRERERARAARDFKRADELRREIAAHGYEVRDSKDGSLLVPRRP